MNKYTTDFYEICQMQLGRASRMGLPEAYMTVADKYPKHLQPEGVEDALTRLHNEGHKVRTERHDSDNDHGFFGYCIWVSVDRFQELDIETK